jgi:diguanylate cyclase (GGDEF)-like protein
VWSLIILIWISPTIFNKFVSEQIEQKFLFIWSIPLIPSMLIMVMYPRWLVVIGTALFNIFLQFVTEFTQDSMVLSYKTIPQIIESIVNTTIHFTIGYFIMTNAILTKKLEQLTIIDSLTELYNRRYFDLQLEKMVSLTQRTNRPLLLLMLDIDFFKKVNDTFGHQCGDEALKHIAQIIRDNTRSTDAYSRIGGEEFAILLSESNLEDGKVIGERIRKAVENEIFTYKNERVHLTISLGLAKYNGEKVNEFIESADKALYQAKTNGRNQLVVNQ